NSITELTSSRLGAGLEMTLMRRERRSVLATVGTAMWDDSGVQRDCQRKAVAAMRNTSPGHPMLRIRLKSLLSRRTAAAESGAQGEQIAEAYLRRECGFRTL